jgi:hypothetical protein
MPAGYALESGVYKRRMHRRRWVSLCSGLLTRTLDTAAPHVGAQAPFWQSSTASSPMDQRVRASIWGASLNSDKPEKPLRFNSASSCLLSECALKLFSRRNPSKLNTRGSIPFTRAEGFSTGTCQAVIAPLDKRADAHSDECPSFVPAAQGQARCARMAGGARSLVLLPSRRRHPATAHWDDAALSVRRPKRTVAAKAQSHRKVSRRRLPVGLTDRPVA